MFSRRQLVIEDPIKVGITVVVQRSGDNERGNGEENKNLRMHGRCVVAEQPKETRRMDVLAKSCLPLYKMYWASKTKQKCRLSCSAEYIVVPEPLSTLSSMAKIRPHLHRTPGNQFESV